ncbi:hypothetical protein SUGI_0493600 [Cryptomeria japonica]|uniref:protein neprosin isoform X1 n=1 Tax=Cryptomeria japonica TaxID=3369 RepID=UPI002408A151|nr:protein neprosin isoform X1 [Cryptomeria japonica]GLJ25780.1 hypothetical protein SUGI_0493600 [Cryptomeria japonica]
MAEGLKLILVAVFLLSVLLTLSISSCLEIDNVTGKHGSSRSGSRRMSVVYEKLKVINKPAIRSIQSPDGDVIDCVAIHQQPGLHHPLLRNHKFQDFPTRPSSIEARANRSLQSGPAHAFQTWHLTGPSCPHGTVPVRRTTVGDLMRVASPEKYGKKSKKTRLWVSQKPSVTDGNGHEHAIAFVKGGEYYGAKASLNVWEPHIEAPGEFSLSQMWVLSGSFDGSDLNSIEAGWQVSPELYGDNMPRLFTYWTSDSYQETGCYNLLCSGFIQTSESVAIGAAINPVSSFNGPQYDITILVWKDPKEGNWWMELGDGTLVGYWPSSLFTHLSDHATTVEWGGEIVNTQQGGDHTSTQMGSGHFANEGFTRASYFRNLQVVDADNSLQDIESVSTLAEDSDCYNIQSSVNADWGTHFYFGGPGQNSKCP